MNPVPHTIIPDFTPDAPEIEVGIPPLPVLDRREKPRRSAAIAREIIETREEAIEMLNQAEAALTRPTQDPMLALAAVREARSVAFSNRTKSRRYLMALQRELEKLRRR